MKDLAVQLCKDIEKVAPEYGFHVALTGGCLYKEGKRKDIDILFYSIRGQEVDQEGLFEAIKPLGVIVDRNCGFVVKARYDGYFLDMLFPECDEGFYDAYSALASHTKEAFKALVWIVKTWLWRQYK